MKIALYKDIKNEIAKIILKDVSFPAHHYWKIFERIIAENLDMTEIRNSLLGDFKAHFADCIEKTQNEENLHQKLNNMASNLSRSTLSKLKPICQHILTSWTHGSIDSVRFSYFLIFSRLLIGPELKLENLSQNQT